jgi:tetratricopeptide (TPR) repeat protein
VDVLNAQECRVPEDFRRLCADVQGPPSPLATPAVTFTPRETAPPNPSGRPSAISAHHLAHKPPAAAVREFKRGLKLKLHGRLEEAREHLAEASRLDPGYWEAHANLADVYWSLHRVTDALDQLDAAIAIDPNNESLHSNRALALRALNRPATVIPHPAQEPCASLLDTLEDFVLIPGCAPQAPAGSREGLSPLIR